MPTDTTKRIGGAALAAALVAAALVAATAPRALARHGEDQPVGPSGTTGTGSNDCNAEFILTFGTEESGSLNQLTGDTEDTWVVDVPDRPGTVELDVNQTSGDAMVVDLFEEQDGTCSQLGTAEVVGPPEFENLADNQRYWARISISDSLGSSAQYTIIVVDD